MKPRYRPGAFAPGPPAGGGRALAFKWPGRPPEKIPAMPLMAPIFMPDLEICKSSMCRSFLSGIGKMAFLKNIIGKVQLTK